MKRTKKISAILMVLLVFGATTVFAGRIDVRRSNEVLSDDYAFSYEVRPTEKVLDTLTEYGIDVGRQRGSVATMAIAELNKIDLDSADPESFFGLWATAMDKLNSYVYSELSAARRAGYELVYMDLGDYRWIIHPDEADD
jgi:hypothetical protein